MGELMLHHRKQESLWGCIYHALYALTGEESLLEHVTDISDPRALIRLHQLGYALLPLHVVKFAGPCADQADAGLWRGLVSQLPEGASALLAVTVDGFIPNTQHAIAVELSRDEVAVSDSAHHALQLFDLENFLSSRYSRANAIEALMPLDLDAFPAVNAGEELARASAAREEQRRAAYLM